MSMMKSTRCSPWAQRPYPFPSQRRWNSSTADSGKSFGYKAAGANAIDEFWNLDTVEFTSAVQDDTFVWPETMRRMYSRTVNAASYRW